MYHSDIFMGLAPPTVVGSHMSLLRPMTPRVLGERANRKSGEVCAFSAALTRL